MTAEDFNAAGEGLLGYGWRRKLAAALGVHYSTVKRWSAGDCAVPAYVVAIFEFLAAVPRASRPNRWLVQAERRPEQYDPI